MFTKLFLLELIQKDKSN